MYADIVLPLAVPGAYTYRLPASLEARITIGSRVVVPLGKNKRYTGIVIRLREDAPALDEDRIKTIEELVDERPLLLESQIELWRWMAQYYMCFPGEVMKAALPAGLKLESETLFSVAEEADPNDEGHDEAEREVLRALMAKPLRVSDLRKAVSRPGLLRTLKNLVEARWITVEEKVSRGFRAKNEMRLTLAPAYASAEALEDALQQLGRSPRQSEAFLAFLDRAGIAAAERLNNYTLLGEVRRSELVDALPDGGTAAVTALVRRGLLISTAVEVGRLKIHKAVEGLAPRPLSPAQQAAHDAILAGWKEKEVVLLHGVTSSGKTEVYIELIRRTLAEGKQVLFLLPEIALTTQITDRLGRVFGEKLGVYHSKFPDNERVEMWQRQLSEKAYPLILGVRSSVFLPFRNLGLIIVDEEHEASYKQQDPAPRYHARDVAILMAHRCGAKVLLGTATPSLESYKHAETGKYALVRLAERFGGVQMPEIVVENLAELQRKKQLPTPFSPRLHDEVEAALQSGRQAILFLNRRGYSPALQCRSCGWTPRCTQCDVPLTLHLKFHKLVCHYCGTQYDVPTHCPQCEQADLRDIGAGTEKIEAAVEACFPTAKVARMDLDTTRSRSAYERIIREFQNGRSNLLVGTQMVTKGLDFGGVSVVGIVNADQLLNACDFRAHERAFQMLSQVAGRAGRRGSRGRVVLQTRKPDLPVVAQIVAGDYPAMYKKEMADRRTFRYPPEVRLIMISFKHRDERTVAVCARLFADLLRPHFSDDLFGPMKPVVSYVQLQHIRRIMLKVSPTLSPTSVRTTLWAARDRVLAHSACRNVTIYFDVDPM